MTSVYISDAILVNSTGVSFVSEAEKMQYVTQLKNELGKIQEVKSDYHITVNESISYEISQVHTESGDRYDQLIIWSTHDSTLRKELEVLARSEDGGQVIDGLEVARADWIQLCNLHNPLQLVKKRYTSDALYYNHKPLVIGTTAIAKEYNYMSSENYSLLLSPLHITSVRPDLAFEIGQCSGSYGGQYMLLWQKDANNVWKVHLDSNL